MIEVSVKISDEDQTLTQKFLLHDEGLRLSHDDPELYKMVNDTLSKFKGHPSDNDVVVRVKYVW